MTSDQICRAQRNKERIITWAKEQLQSPNIGKRRLGQAALGFAGAAPLEAWLGIGEDGQPLVRPAGDPYRVENPTGIRVLSNEDL